MSLARVQQFSISLDGFGTGEPQSLDAPFGHAGERLHEWMFATRWWGEMVGQPGGSGGIDDAFLRLHDSSAAGRIYARPPERLNNAPPPPEGRLRLARLDETGLVRGHHRLHAVTKAELHEDVRDVRLHCGLAHEQLGCDLGV
jgi:hypothetical protein